MTKILKNFNLFVDGRGYAGRIDELTPPKLTIKTEEFRGGGMDAPISIDMGMEKLECSFSLMEYDPDILTQFGVVSGNSVQLTLRGALTDETTTIPMTINLHGMYTEVDMGKFKAGDRGMMTCNVACRYYKLEINSKPVVEIDVDNMVRKINGTDQLTEVRSALGI